MTPPTPTPPDDERTVLATLIAGGQWSADAEDRFSVLPADYAAADAILAAGYRRPSPSPADGRVRCPHAACTPGDCELCGGDGTLSSGMVAVLIERMRRAEATVEQWLAEIEADRDRLRAIGRRVINAAKLTDAGWLIDSDALQDLDEATAAPAEKP